MKKPDNYILYATGKYYLNMFSWEGTSTPSNYKLYCYQKKILAYLDNLPPHIRTIFKLHPQPFYGQNPIETKRVEKVHLEKSFVELLDKAILVIFDSPSTTLLQAANRYMPIFVLQGYINFSKECWDLLTKRAVVFNSPEKLIKEIDLYLKTGDYKADVDNREFIKEYGTHFDDGRSTERAVDFILKVVEGNEYDGNYISFNNNNPPPHMVTLEHY